MLAPLRLPPCLMASVAASKTRMKDTGPEAIPPVERTVSPSGRRREKEYPVPPPVCWTMAPYFTASYMLSMESLTGMTKHAESCWMSVPAFMSVGELGRNSSELMARKNSSSSPWRSP